MNTEIVINDINLNEQAIKEVSKLIAIKFMEDRAEKRSIGNCKKIKRKRIEKADRLDDIRTVGNVCILILKFFVLLNVLVITSKML